MRASVLVLAACGAPAATGPVVTNAKRPPAACIPAKLAAELGSEPGFAHADGDTVELCVTGSTTFCMRVDPATGDVVGKLPPSAQRSEDLPAPEGYTPPFPTADNTMYAAVLDPSHRLAFVLGVDGKGDNVGDTYEIATGKRVARADVSALAPKDQPPPPIDATWLEWHAGAVVIGKPDGYALLVDPRRGVEVFLVPGHVILGDHLLVGHDWMSGEAFVDDLTASVREIARKKLGARHADGSVVEIAIAATADHAIAVGFAPLVTLVIDRNGTVSEPRPLPICAPH